VVGEAHVTDRRIVRANRTRDSVVDALLELIDEGNLRPTAREIAARAHVSLRSVYVHFDDVDALFHAAAIRHDERLDAVRGELVTTGSFEERLQAFVDRRARVYERSRHVGHAALLLEPFSPAMRSILDQARQTSWGELEVVFAAELGEDDDSRRCAVLDMLTHVRAWDTLRSHHGLTVDDAKAAVCDVVRAFLVGPRDRDPTVEATARGT
jgi:TetR/AcrR family transcriptional regulator, regulator of autoinduction and epiphytic fitness